MFLLFLVSFKVIPPQKLVDSKMIIKARSHQIDCEQGQNQIFDHTNIESKNIQAFFYCANEDPSPFILSNCIFNNVVANNFGTSIITNFKPEYLIRIYHISCILYMNTISYCNSKKSLIQIDNTNNNIIHNFNMSSNKITQCDHGTKLETKYLLELNNVNVELFNNSISYSRIRNEGSLIILQECKSGISFKMFSNTIEKCDHNGNQKAKYLINVKDAETYFHDNTISDCYVYDSIIAVENSLNLEMFSNTIKNCNHKDINENRLIIYIQKANAYLFNNNITDCTHYKKGFSLIQGYCDTDNYYFKFYSNIITNCYCNEGLSNTITTNYRTNDFRDNIITYNEDSSKSERAFNIEYNSGCQLINNTVKNAYHVDSSAFKLSYSNNNNNQPAVIKDCIFINCKGNNDPGNGGLMVIIENLDYDLEFINVTFRDTDIAPNLMKRQNSFLIRVETTLDNPPSVKFTGCSFINLVNCEESTAGGIGFIYKSQNGKVKTVIFENTIFQQIQNKNQDIGGAIFIAPDDKARNVNLNVKGCNFTDVKSAGNGGAIGFDSASRELIIENCIFDQVGTTSDKKNGGVIYTTEKTSDIQIVITDSTFKNTNSAEGGAIYIEKTNSKIKIDGCIFLNTIAQSKGNSIVLTKTNDDQVIISNCKFNDCGDNLASYTVHLDVSTLLFENNEFSFSDKKCGCVHLENIGDHQFIGNTFTNAQYKSLLGKSSGINYEKITPITSLILQNNTFDNINGDYKGRCFSFTVQKSDVIKIFNNTIQNCKDGGPFFRISFIDSQTSFEIDSMRFITNSVKSEILGMSKPIPHFFVENPLLLKDYGDPLELKLTNCFFYNNENPSNGGALYYGISNIISNTKLHLTGCQFIGNSAINGDGALCISCYQGFECEGCNFTRNKSERGNGIISIQTKFDSQKDDQTTISPPSITTNPEILFTRCYFEKEIANNNEIVIHSSKNTIVKINECTFQDAINKNYIVYIDEDNIEDVKIYNCSFLFTDQNNNAAAVLSSRDKIEFLGNTFQKCKSKTIHIECQILETNSFKIIENRFIDCFKAPIIWLQNSITSKPVIEGNTFDNIVVKDLIFEFKLLKAVDSIDFKNNTFANFDIQSEARGIGFKIENEDTSNPLKLTFENCYFITNKNEGAISCGINQNKGNTYLTMKECYFKDNKHANNGGAVFINVKNDILIEKCEFISNSATKGSSIYIEPDFEGEPRGTKITISNCNFNQNTPINDGISSVYIASSSQKILQVEYCTFEDENGGLYINDFNQNMNIESNTFLNGHKGPSLHLTSSSTKSQLTIYDCVFDSCQGDENKCFYLLFETRSFTFENCIIQNLEASGVNSYSGTFDVRDGRGYTLLNVSFINNTCNSLYGGGTGIRFIEFGSLFITECKFINNSAIQDTSQSRPSLGGKQYYNGDGGAIQIGYHCKMYDMNVDFYDCLFKNNRAQRHGGAIAAQTYHDLAIFQCTFENNIANFDFSSLSLYLLYDAYYDLKDEGRGGALYINPAFSYDSNDECPAVNGHSSTITIDESNFTSNTARDGYALYIEGDDAETNYIIKNNIFEDNYNLSNYKLDSNVIYGAVISTEICRLTKEKIEEENKFKYSKEELVVNSILCVDHYGHSSSPKFSQSFEFTSSRDFVGSNVFTYSKEFTRSNPFTDSQTFSMSGTYTQSKAFTHSAVFTASATFTPAESSFESSNEVVESSSNEVEQSSSNIIPPDSSNEVIQPDSSNEVIQPDSSNEVIQPDSSNEVIQPDSSNEVIQPDSSNEVIQPDSSNEVIQPDSSNEVIQPDSSNEVIQPDSSNEVIQPDSSNEVIQPDSSNEVIQPDSSNEVIQPDSSNEVIQPDSSNEVVPPDSSNEVVPPDSSNEVIQPDSSNEVVPPDSSNEVIQPDSSNEVVPPDSSNEVIPPESSNEVIPTDEPTDQLGSLCLAIQTDKNVTINNRCDFTSSDNSSLVFILRSNFTSFINESNGGAIYVNNCGLHSRQTSFIECTSINGAGGAMYIKNRRYLEKNIVLENLTFIRCRAVFGGACYIYQNAEENEVSILSCTFIGNIATKTRPTDKKDHFFGGSSVFLSSKNANVIKSSFQGGKGSGGTFKIYNKFDEEASNVKILNENQNQIFFDDCSFDNQEESKSPINYVIDNKSSLVIKECNFNGKLETESHYIKGEMLTKSSSMPQIKLCSFEYEDNNDKFNSNIDDNHIINDRKKPIENHNYVMNVICIGIFVLTITFVCIRLKKHISSANEDNSYDFNDDTLNNGIYNSEL